MRISITTSGIYQKFGQEEAIRMIARAGFDCVDLSMNRMSTGFDDPLMQIGYQEYAAKLRKVAENSGICFNQAHAPFSMKMNVWETDPEAWDDILLRLRRSIEIAGIIGAPRIVVHPVQYMDYYNADRGYMLQKNLEFYRLLIPTARETGVKICLENMWRIDPNSKAIRDSICASPYELVQYVDTLNAEENLFCACLDVGHCNICGYDPVHAIRVLGHRLEALHIHDTNFRGDLHTCPLTAYTDQYAIAEALRDVGYKGDYTLETDNFLYPFRLEFCQEALNFEAKVSRHLADIAEGQS